MLHAGYSLYSLIAEGKDLIISYTVKHEQNLDCGGAYIKVGSSGCWTRGGV